MDDIKVTGDNFNSHAHVERDNITPQQAAFPTISTHTLTWSVTPHSTRIDGFLPFQLTRSRGA